MVPTLTQRIEKKHVEMRKKQEQIGLPASVHLNSRDRVKGSHYFLDSRAHFPVP